MHQLKIKGRIPSKKNSRNVFVKGKRLFNIPSERYRKWHISATEQLIGAPSIAGVCEVQMEFLMPDKRKADLTNKAESIMDLLVDLKIIEDDTWQIVPRILLYCSGVDREDPGVTVWIKET